MCYLRNFTPISKTIAPKHRNFENQEPLAEKKNFPRFKMGGEFDFLTVEPCMPKNAHIFDQILRTAQKNLSLLSELEQKFCQTDQCLLDLEGEEQCTAVKIEGSPISEVAQIVSSGLEKETESVSTNQLSELIFGDKQYRYKLALAEEFPEKVFKERNFNVSVKLQDSNGFDVKNSNIMHLCLGVCSSEGTWISDTKTGEAMIKGKSESELYHGMSSFDKIYFRDISRHYSEDGNFNIVIYPKESAVQYSHQARALEQKVSFEDIEPLVIRDLQVKAKKK